MKARVLIFVLIAVGGLILGKPVYAEDINIKFSTGADYSKGDYGRTQDTEILYSSLATKVSYGSWSAKVTVPYLHIKGSAAVLGGGDTVIVCDDNSGPGKGGGCPAVDPNAVVTREGLGDIIGGLTYTIDLKDYGLYLDFTGKIKLPTADEDKGLGTGETDYTIQVDATKMFGSAYIFGGVGRRFIGESAQFQLNDIWLLNVGGGYQVNKKMGVGVAYDFREAASTAEDPSEASAYLTYKFSDSMTTMLYGVVGFSNGSPDASVGLQLSYKFDLF